MYLDPRDASLASANELITQMTPDLGKAYFDMDTCLSVFVYAFARHENYIILGMTDPKTIDPSLLHPWLRTCFRNPNLEKQIAKDNGDIDVYAVSTMIVEHVLDLVRVAQCSTVQRYSVPLMQNKKNCTEIKTNGQIRILFFRTLLAFLT